jgi:hypothetical protein
MSRCREARKLRRAARRFDRALWTRDIGYGMGKRFDLSDDTYAKAAEIRGSIEALARWHEAEPHPVGEGEA